MIMKSLYFVLIRVIRGLIRQPTQNVAVNLIFGVNVFSKGF